MSCPFEPADATSRAPLASAMSTATCNHTEMCYHNKNIITFVVVMIMVPVILKCLLGFETQQMHVSSNRPKSKATGQW